MTIYNESGIISILDQFPIQQLMGNKTPESGSGDTPVNIPALMDPKTDSSYARDYLTSWDKEELLKKYPQ